MQSAEVPTTAHREQLADKFGKVVRAGDLLLKAIGNAEMLRDQVTEVSPYYVVKMIVNATATIPHRSMVPMQVWKEWHSSSTSPS